MMPSAIAATPDRSIDERRLRRLAALAAAERLFALAEQPVAADAHVVEEQHAGRRRVQAHLAQRLRLLEAGHALVEHELQRPCARRAGCPRRACR